MKKFLMYVIIVVTCLFLGFTVYYLTQNNENFIAVAEDNAIYKNKGEFVSLDDLLVWSKPYKTTTLSIVSADETVVKYDEATSRFNCEGGGLSIITITPSNENFGPFVYEIHVGDGSTENPYFVDSAEDLAKIGNDSQNVFQLTNSYNLVKDISLTTDWTPLGKFEGTFNGKGHTIYNLKISQGTNVGLFSEISDKALVQNIKFTNAIINGSFDNAGVVAGINNGTIGKIDVQSSMLTNTNSTGYTGAIAGTSQKEITPATINMCSANTIISSSGIAGGLVGFNKSSIILNSKVVVESYISTSEQAKFGGLVGVNGSTLTADEIYYASAIKTSFVIIKEVSAENSTIGAIACENKEDKYETQMFYNIYDGVLYALGDNVTIANAVSIGSEDLTTDAKNNIVNKSMSDMLDTETYNGFEYDFSNVWLRPEGKFANINFDGIYETYKSTGIGKTILASQGVTLLSFLNSIQKNPAAVTATYVIDQSGELDLSEGYPTTQYWTTLAPSQNNPMQASIVVEEGVTFTIKNFKLKEDNSSFFGYLSGSTIVDGLTFENVIIESCNDVNSGVVASALLTGSTLQNITVKNFKCTATKAQNVGIICGKSSGTIKNCNVIGDNSNSSDPNCSVTLSDNLVSMGSIVGYNASGFVSNCKIVNVRLGINSTEKESGSINFGGAVGTSEGNISKCKVNSFVCESSTSGSVYAGGLVGYVQKNGSSKISESYSCANIKISTTSSKAFVGGIVSYLGEDAVLENSFYSNNGSNDNNVELDGYNVGAIACIGGKNSTITSCYADNCYLYGKYIGGLVAYAKGYLNNCYTFATMDGTGKKAVVCGMTREAAGSCDIRNNFVDVTFKGSGDRYAETETTFRLGPVTKAFNPNTWNQKVGPIVKNVILHENKSTIQMNNAIISREKKGWIECTRKECNGTEGSYSVFKTNGFSDTIWNFDEETNNSNGGYPTLKNIAIYED